jgi:hypothetical protein
LTETTDPKPLEETWKPSQTTIEVTETADPKVPEDDLEAIAG